MDLTTPAGIDAWVIGRVEGHLKEFKKGLTTYRQFIAATMKVYALADTCYTRLDVTSRPVTPKLRLVK